jgi:hypothetical protein
VPAELRLTRETPFVLFIEFRRGVFDISVDGKTVGSIKSHGTVEVPLEPGHHTLQILRGRYSSRVEDFDVADDRVVNYRCHGTMGVLVLFTSFLKPDLAISLKPA